MNHFILQIDGLVPSGTDHRKRSKKGYTTTSKNEGIACMNNFEKKKQMQITCFTPLSSWMPPKRRDAALESYIKKTRTDVESHLNDLQAKRCKDNLLPEERSALKTSDNAPT